MSMEKILPLIESLSHSDKFQLIQLLLTQLASEEGFYLPIKTELKNKQGQRMTAILQRMADRKALPNLTDPVVWQREIRDDRPLPDRG